MILNCRVIVRPSCDGYRTASTTSGHQVRTCVHSSAPAGNRQTPEPGRYAQLAEPGTGRAPSGSGTGPSGTAASAGPAGGRPRRVLGPRPGALASRIAISDNPFSQCSLVMAPGR